MPLRRAVKSIVKSYVNPFTSSLSTCEADVTPCMHRQTRTMSQLAGAAASCQHWRHHSWDKTCAKHTCRGMQGAHGAWAGETGKGGVFVIYLGLRQDRGVTELVGHSQVFGIQGQQHICICSRYLRAKTHFSNHAPGRFVHGTDLLCA